MKEELTNTLLNIDTITRVRKKKKDKDKVIRKIREIKKELGKFRVFKAKK